jgi:A/G-specific adenine glycosylase
MPEPDEIISALLRWKEASRRDLPWRRRRDPYAVWVSEIMLQQTRAKVAAPYFLRWVQRFPDVQSLAGASLEEVLRAWEGLGYYSRAHNLHRAAQQIVARWGGRLPADRRLLLSLPGIGPYTAGAILSLAFGLPEPAVDGNTRRVLSRLFDVEDDVAEAATQRRLWDRAAELSASAASGRAGDLNEALMDLGALVCRPRAPDCDACPVSAHCVALARGVQEERPVRAGRRPARHFDAVAAVIWDAEERLLVIQRPAGGLLGGLWGLPGGLVTGRQTLQGALQAAVAHLLGIDAGVGELLTSFRHAYTHFSITLHVYCCELLAGEASAVNCQQVAWVPVDQTEALPFSVTDRKILRSLADTRRALCDSPDQGVE